jgi:hypothetical protein
MAKWGGAKARTVCICQHIKMLCCRRQSRRFSWNCGSLFPCLMIYLHEACEVTSCTATRRTRPLDGVDVCQSCPLSLL